MEKITLKLKEIKFGIFDQEILIYHDEKGKEYVLDAVYGLELDIKNSFYFFLYKSKYLPEKIEGKIKFEDSRVIGIEDKLLYRFKKSIPKSLEFLFKVTKQE